MTDNRPTELELLRRVASAVVWAIESNRDDVVGRDGRARVGMNWVAANGALNGALRDLREHYPPADMHEAGRAEAASIEAMLRRSGKQGKK